MSAITPFFTAEFFTGNRDKLRALFTGTAPIILTANGVVQRGGDTTFPFHQDSSFWYLTGVNEPDVILVLDKGKEYLILPPKGDHQLIFDTVAEVAALQERSGIKTILESEVGWKQLESRLKKVKHIATLSVPPTFIPSHGFYTNPARRMLLKRIRKTAPTAELLDLREHLTRLRVIKQTEELRAIQAAIDITGKALKVALKKREKYSYEHEIEAAITGEFRRNGSQHAFHPIVAAGQNTCTLHYMLNEGSVASKDLLITDIGAEVEHYAADITRTYAFRSPTKRQQSVFDAVLAVQEHAMSLIKPGVLPMEYEHNVEQFMGETLRRLGLIKSIDHENVRRYFPHSTTHFLGLDVHDIGDYSRPFEAGAVVTVEPGIYIPEEGIGIRIEDDVLITPKEVRVLSRKIPKQLW